MFLHDPAKVQQNTKPSPAPLRCWPAADTGSVSPAGQHVSVNSVNNWLMIYDSWVAAMQPVLSFRGA